MSRVLTWLLIILVCLALIAVLLLVIGFLADQTGEASLLKPGIFEAEAKLAAYDHALALQTVQPASSRNRPLR
jgi:hypothetical protein